MINTGKLNRYVEIWQSVEVEDGQGGRDVEYQFVCNTWAELLRPRFARSDIQGGFATDVTQGIRMRPDVDVYIGWQVRIGSHVFEVMHPADESTVGEIILTTREVVR